MYFSPRPYLFFGNPPPPSVCEYALPMYFFQELVIVYLNDKTVMRPQDYFNTINEKKMDC